MHWNYRVLAIPDGDDLCLTIHEVYYNKKGQPESHSKEAAIIQSDNVEGLKWHLQEINKCLKKTWLWGDDRFPQQVNPPKQVNK